MACVCLLQNCGWETAEPEELIAKCRTTWHVYEDRPDIWLALIGDRPPRDPDPRIPAVRAQISGN
jgi:hypothetical protein